MVDSAASGLLSPQENSSVWNILRRAHRKNQSLATAVAKLYVTEPDSKHRKWVEQVTGVVCFVKDFLRKSYFIQIIDLDYHQKVWEQELYIEFVYKATQKWFHMFEADHGVAGISFADEREGETFRNVVENKLQSRRKPNRLPSPSSPGNMPRSPSTKRQAQLHNNQVPVPRITTTPTKDKKSIKRGSGKGKKLNKLDISGPDTSSFVHVSGMKMAGGGGMEMIDNSSQLDPRLRKYLVIAGIDPSALDASQLQKATEFAEKEDIYGKIERRKTARRTEKRNTLEKASKPKPRMEQISEGPPSVPSRPPPRPDGRRPPQPPPAQKPSPNRKPGVPPPPPPSSSSGGGAPPPPPPPPPAGGLAPPPLPSFGKPGGGKPSPAASPGGSKTDLLAAIRNAGGKSGAGLRSVGDRMSSEDRSSVEDGGGDFQSLLAGALDKINTAAGISSSEDESEDSDDWDDDDY